MIPLIRKSFDADTVRHARRMQSQDYDLLHHLDALIRGLKADGVWGKIDVLCVAAKNEVDSLLNIVSGNYTAANINGCAFVADLGFTVSATGSKYLNSGFACGGGSHAQHNNTHLWLYQRTFAHAGIKYAIGASDTASLVLRIQENESNTPDQVGYFSDAGAGQANLQQDVPVGFIGGTRRSDIDAEIRVNGSTATSSGATTGNLPAGTIYVGCGNTSGVPSSFIESQIAGWGIGGGLSSAELGALRDRIQTYMTARGAAV